MVRVIFQKSCAPGASSDRRGFGFMFSSHSVLSVMCLRFMLGPRASEIREAGDHPSCGSHQSGPVERMSWSGTRRKVIPAQLLYLGRNHRNVESSSRKLFLAGTPPCLFRAQAKPHAHAQISDEDRQKDQPECEGIEHGFE